MSGMPVSPESGFPGLFFYAGRGDWQQGREEIRRSGFFTEGAGREKELRFRAERQS